MDAQRKKFLAALLIFSGWVGSLATLAAFSGHRPAPRTVESAPR
jgi:hypothetical protein